MLAHASFLQLLAFCHSFTHKSPPHHHTVPDVQRPCLGAQVPFTQFSTVNNIAILTQASQCLHRLSPLLRMPFLCLPGKSCSLANSQLQGHGSNWIFLDLLQVQVALSQGEWCLKLAPRLSGKSTKHKTLKVISNSHSRSCPQQYSVT